jgi:hypothetical protein
MKFGFLLLFIIVSIARVQGQEDSSHLFPDELLATVENSLPNHIAATLLAEFKEKLTSDPDLYNRAWKKILDNKQKGFVFSLIRDMNIEFKTFELQKEDRIGLGFKYDWDFDWMKYNNLPLKRNGVSIQFQSHGNVAFRKELNPFDFLSTGLSFGGFQYSGGVARQTTAEVRDLLNELEISLAMMTTVEEIENSQEWKTFNEYLQLTDQYYVGFDGVIELENSQDFTKKQLVAGIKLGLGAKGWAENSTLSYFNLPDYPFALIRLITGTDKNFNPDGATIPVLMARVDYVNPVADNTRKTLTGNENSFARLNVEIGFRTLIAEIKEHAIYFNADARFFKELNAPEIIRQADLHRHNFLQVSISSSRGFFASFATGKLPFDATNNNVYELGFRHNFN